MRPLLVALAAVLVLTGCGGGEPEAVSTPSAPSVAPSSAAPSSVAPSSAAPTPTPSSAAPSSPSASPTPSRSASPASTKDGTYATELSVSEDGALTYTPLRWYDGANAKARCDEKDVKSEGAFCEDYYYEEDGGRKSAALTETTKVRLLDEDDQPASASLADLVQAIEDEVFPNYQIAVSGGRVTQITQVFTP